MKNIYLCVYSTSVWIWLEDQILIFMELKNPCKLFVLFLWYKNVYFTLQDHKRIEAQKMEIRENQLQMMISMSTKTHWSHLFSFCTLTAIDFKGSHVPSACHTWIPYHILFWTHLRNKIHYPLSRFWIEKQNGFTWT